MKDNVADQLRKMLERELSFHEQAFLRTMRLCFDHNVPHGWMSLAVALEWADMQGGELARIDESVDMKAQIAACPADWRKDSSLETWFPYTSEAIVNMKAQIAALKRGEYICNKCGLRKDGECEAIEF